MKLKSPKYLALLDLIERFADCARFYRQELVRRKAFDLDEDKVNFKALLQRLMVELVADENAAVEQKTKAIEDQAAEAREKAKQERELKKAEALERSKQRQADPSYFKKRVEVNEEGVAAKEKAKIELQELPVEIVEDGEESEEDAQNDDLFRTYKKKTKSKVYVK